MEINPNHPATQAVREQWHKIAAIIMVKQGLTEMEITPDDINHLAALDQAILADCRGGRFVIRMMDEKDAMKLARAEGGLPV